MHLTYLNEGNTIQILTGRVQIRTVAGSWSKRSRWIGYWPFRDRPHFLDGPFRTNRRDYLALAVLNYGDSGTDVAGGSCSA